MFCPKCATQNLEGASFCRTCGANISLVPQALTGQLPQPRPAELDESCGIGRGRRGLTLERAFKNIAMGFAFLIVSIVLSRTGQNWWFWMLFPSFVFTSTGIAQFIRLKEKAKSASLAPPPVQRTFGEAPNTNVLMPPPVASVTESTTRHLNANERR